MGIYVPERLVLVRQILQQLQLEEVFQQISMIACVKGMVEIQHGFESGITQGKMAML